LNEAAADVTDECVVGMVLRDWPTVVTAERQARYHAAAEVPQDLFGDSVDLSILANDTILATSYLKTQAVDGLHAGQRMRQHEPVRLDEPLTLKGRIASIRATAKGNIVVYAFDFQRRDGSIPVTGELISFQVDPAAMRKTGAGKPGAADTTGFHTAGHKALRPELVAAYSFEFLKYLVHFDAEEAASVGLRAPVAQGLMQLTALHGAIVKRAMPWEMDVEICFLRPVFWDSQLTLYADLAGQLYRCIDQDGKLTAEATLHHLTIQDMEP
jgi:hypothetical protein